MVELLSAKVKKNRPYRRLEGIFPGQFPPTKPECSRPLSMGPFQETVRSTKSLFDILQALVKEKREFRPRTVIIYEILKEAVSDLRLARSHEPIQTPIALEVPPEVALATVSTDADLLRSCVADILDNSFRAIVRSGSNSGAVRISCESVDGGKIIQVVFEDSGPGFEKDTLSRVNDGLPLLPQQRFGLGISLQGCKAFVERSLGGSFKAMNLPEGHGARIEWRIPVDVKEQTNVEATSGSH